MLARAQIIFRPGFPRVRLGAVALLLALLLPGRASAQGDGMTPSRRQRCTQAVQRIAGASDEQLRAQYESEKHEYRLFARPFDRDLANCIVAWERFRDPGARDQALRALAVALLTWQGLDGQGLAARITGQGSRDTVNLDLRDACLHYAQRFRLTSDPADRDRAVALLARFVDAVPKWPIWTPYYGPPESRRPLPPDQPSSYQGEFAAGPWGLWIYMDLIMGTPLLEAWTLLRDQISDASLNDRARAFFMRCVEIQRMHAKRPDYTNMDAFQIRGFLDFGRLLPDAALLREGVGHLETLYRIGFFPDGWWHEASSSYHSDLQRGLRAIIDDLPSDYSDPPDFKPAGAERWDGVDLSRRVARACARADGVVRDNQLPDGRMLASHDSNWDDRAWLPRPSAPGSRLWGCMGQATLISSGTLGETQVSLHYGASGTHAHHDSLSLTLWDDGYEAISETAYRPIDGSGSTREWQASTPGHATVVVDERDQSAVGPLKRRVRTPTPDDAVPGVPDWPWRWSSCGVDDFGTLRLFNRIYDQVQVIEAEAAAAYDSVAPVTAYRRTVALVRIDEVDAYVCDIFRVRGGRTHDFMLHGCLQELESLRTTVRQEATPGTLHGMIGSLASGRSDDAWGAVFGNAAGPKLVSMFAASPGTLVISGQAPAMRRLGQAPFLVVRREGPESIFVVVHEVVRDANRRVRGVELATVQGEGVVAVKITLDGRTDFVMSGDGPGSAATVDGHIGFRGSFGHVRETGSSLVWAFLVDGDSLKVGDAAIEGATFFTGDITRVDRIEAGQDSDAFITPLAVEAGLLLADEVLLVDPPGLPRWAYPIESVQRVTDGSRMLVASEPGLTVSGDLVKQSYFPSWGGRGAVHFRIPGSALLLRKDAASPWTYSGTSAARGKAPGLSPQ